ncbi:hypothetical protein [Tamlana crocina]|uniref:Uncharacterized protein n=1 Tax=Tamlana crocina TaxID=393006 RepID=A0ABX1D9E8_9FLAO|nr:hypothetical protein [Tamlana crocina]NJX15000.1 hypothetical protein [Tamlana crocina]
MKLKILLLFLLISIQNHSQIFVGTRHIGKSSKFEKGGALERFKNTETIFVLSNIYEKEVYEQIIDNSWNITPYKVVKFEDFNLEDYLNDKYSIAEISGTVVVKDMKYGGTTSKLFTYVDFKLYDSKSIFEEKNKLSSEKWTKRKEKILAQNFSIIAGFYLYQKDDFIHIAEPSNKAFDAFTTKIGILDTPEYMNSVIGAMYSKNVFLNYKPGFLKNYLQKINNLLLKGELYWMDENDFLPELKKLASHKLYVPSYMTIKYNGWTRGDKEKNDKNIEDIFAKYDYKYEIISDEELNNKIMKNEELYYLRYVRMNTERFLQVVNAKTGDIVYRNYISGLSYNIKSKHIKELNDKIKKVSKN